MRKLQINKLRNLLKGNVLKPVGLAGIALIIILAAALLFLTISRNEVIFPGTAGRSFTRELMRYDDALAVEQPEQLEKRLDRLEKQAKNQDEWLSLLKRRRNLARMAPQFVEQYQKSAAQAVKDFPYSEVMAAIAGESLLFDAKANAVFLQNYAKLLSQPRFAPLALSFYALSGVLGDVAQTLAINERENLFFAELSPGLKDALQVNSILLDILDDKTAAATVEISALLGANPSSSDVLILAGEFFYDYGNPLRAADVFSRLGEGYIGRTADALALAGDIPAAQNIWTALASGQENNSQTIIPSLYNLAATSGSEDQAAGWLERVLTSQNGSEIQKLYAIIRYTRLQNTSRSIVMLEDQNLTDNPLLDLELLRRRLEAWSLERSITGFSPAEIWLLIGRHPESLALYQWAAWFFERQKLYTETAQLLKIAGQREISAPWLELTRALTLLREGSVNEGFAVLEAEIEKTPAGDWRLYANKARIMESRRSIAAAIDLYEQAASLADNPMDMSQIQLRISRCLQALGRLDESRSALEYALELDADNFNARMEIWRLDSLNP